VPVNRFLSRGSAAAAKEDDAKSGGGDGDDKKRRFTEKGDAKRDDRRGGSRHGREKIKGRGRITYKRSVSRSRSRTPPHWRAESR
jgi:hypothetical protein